MMSKIAITGRSTFCAPISKKASINTQKPAVANKTSMMKTTQPVFARSFAMAAQAAQTKKAPEAMFCFQCEQTNNGKGCTTIGVCGKTPEVAALQDLLVQSCKATSAYVHEAYTLGAAQDRELDIWVLEGLFSTVTNVNFDAKRFAEGYLSQAHDMLLKAKDLYEKACKAKGVTPKNFSSLINPEYLNTKDAAVLTEHGHKYAIPLRKAALGDDYVGLQEMVLYGIKGTGAYAHHAFVLGVEDKKVFAEFHRLIAALNSTTTPIPDLLQLAMDVGALNLKVMEMLDSAATTAYGNPVPTAVRTTPVKGHCIAVSGHDLKDLEEVLKATEGTGINVYTHGELLPANAYPGLKKYKHLIGNFGTAWQMQKLEFAMFPGPILMTTNCIVEPRKAYKDRIFTRSVVGWPGVQHIEGNDFSKLIAKALECPGYLHDEKEVTLMTGFHRTAVLGIADQIVHAVQAGQIKHFFLIGGCDGSEGERNYFKELALNAPHDAVILTLACGKFRFNKYEFGHIEHTHIPRLLDIGQCNDTYSAIQIAVALANAFKTDVNSLPLSFNISWFEQKAVAVLLTLLHLGIKNIHLGPKLPAFATPNMLNILVEKFQLAPAVDWKQQISHAMKKA